MIFFRVGINLAVLRLFLLKNAKMYISKSKKLHYKITLLENNIKLANEPALVNIRSDNILIKLREDHGSGYHVPKGFLFNKISNPNYFGEILEWLGWFIMTLSPAGLVFFIWTMANLIPRAKSNHEWCLKNIEGYPTDRKKVIPFLY